MGRQKFRPTVPGIPNTGDAEQYPDDITEVNKESYPTWSLDGKRLAFFANPGDSTYGSSGIFIVNAGGGDLTFLTDVEMPEGKTSPQWSPDGSQIAYERENQIFVINIDGSNPKSLTSPTFKCEDPAWAPSSGGNISEGQRPHPPGGNEIQGSTR